MIKKSHMEKTIKILIIDYICVYTYILIEREKERERERISCKARGAPQGVQKGVGARKPTVIVWPWVPPSHCKSFPN